MMNTHMKSETAALALSILRIGIVIICEDARVSRYSVSSDSRVGMYDNVDEWCSV